MSNSLSALRDLLATKKTAAGIGIISTISSGIARVATASGVISVATESASISAGDSVIISNGSIIGKVERVSTVLWID